MSSKRTTRCVEYLQLSEALCVAADLLGWDIKALQSEIALEVLAWHELIDDAADLESRLHHLIELIEGEHVLPAAC